MYTAYYGLKEEPFRLTPDPRFLHLAEPHRDVLTRLVEGVLLRKGMLMLCGSAGTGKTTLLHTSLQLLSHRSVSKHPVISAFLTNPTLTPAELLEAIMDELEVKCLSTSKPRQLAALHEALLVAHRAGGTAVLFIDEAHLLTPQLLEEIRLLSNMDSYSGKLLQIVLSGQPEMLTLLARREMSAFLQRIATRCQLRPLSAPETRAYVAERLHVAGLRGTSPFTGLALEEIQHRTNGVPRLINLVSDACLWIGYRTQRSQVGVDVVGEAAATLGIGEASLTGPGASLPKEFGPVSGPSKSAVDTLIEAMKQSRSTQ